MYGVRPQGGKRKEGRREEKEGKEGGETWQRSKRERRPSLKCSRCGGPACLLWVNFLDTCFSVPSPLPLPLLLFPRPLFFA